MALETDEALYLSEQRRYRRLEVALSVWLAEEDAYNKPGATAWSLGYTRDLSMGGSKVIVPPGEQARWDEVSKRDGACLLRFDVPDLGESDFVVGRVKRAAKDQESGGCWLGVEYDDGAEEVKAAVLKAGLKTVKTRQRWQALTALSLVVIILGGVLVTKLRGDVSAKDAEIAKLHQTQSNLDHSLNLLSQPGMVGTRAEGIESSFQRKEVQKAMKDLSADIKRLSNGQNADEGSRERDADAAKNGQNFNAAPATGANVNLGIALPYGYAWPQVTSDLEQLIGRHVPTVVIFKDFKSPFPIGDCRQALVSAKTLQVTWEPWQYSNPKAVTLSDINNGKYDQYIDSWATAAKSFGSDMWIRWGHEFNGNWYPWSISNINQDPQTYVKAFRHVHDRFTKAGAFNVRWVWCMNAETVPNVSWNDPLKAYPGDSYVDMISIDGYNFGTALPHSNWQTFDDVFAVPYERVTNNFPNKPVMINEIGCATVGGDKVAWMRDMDRQLRNKYPKVQGVVWFEAAKEADWRMDSTPDSVAASQDIWSKEYYQRGVP